jgi:hypothetical protein
MMMARGKKAGGDLARVNVALSRAAGDAQSRANVDPVHRLVHSLLGLVVDAGATRVVVVYDQDTGTNYVSLTIDGCETTEGR